MAEQLDSLTLLLQLVEPGLTTSDLYSRAANLVQSQWDAIVDQAYLQGVSELLYILLLKLEESHGFEIPQKERLYQTHLTTAAKNMLILHDAGLVFLALRQAGITSIALKGVFLLENVYGEIGSRSMNDTDILVKRDDLAAAINVLNEMGYRKTSYFSLDDSNSDTKHLAPMQKANGLLVEVHWTLLEENEPFIINPDALWERARPVKIANMDALSLGVEDQILHLCLHLTYQHYLQLGLRGLLDVAMVIHKFSAEMDWGKLIQTAKSWRTEKITALTLKLVETQLKVPIPPEVFSSLLPEQLSEQTLENARSVLLDRVNFHERLTPDLVEMNTARHFFSKIKVALRRVFIPRLALARTYNVPPDSIKIYGLYWVRLRYLIRNYWGTVRRLQKDEGATQTALNQAKISYSLHDWMSE